MPPSVTELQQRAIEHARSGNFGIDALEANLELTRIAPENEGAWTRLARCYLELGQLDEATRALDSVLQLNPQNTIARNLQIEVTKRRTGATSVAAAPRTRVAGRARAPRERGRASAASAGFGRPEFLALGQLPPTTAVESLGPRIETLLMTLSDRPFADKVTQARNRAGHPGSKLYRRNSFHPGDAGHLYAFHHGGRWEPQFNIGFFAAPQWGRDAIRAGIGFNFTPAGADREREAGPERVLAHFEAFQRLVSSEWRQLLTDWMGANGGFIQYGSRPPATDLLPKNAVEWLIDVRNAAETGWIFFGRWLFADRAEDAPRMADAGALASTIERAFADLLPLWMSVYRAG